MTPPAYPTSRWLHSDMIHPDLRIRSSSPSVEMIRSTIVSSCITLRSTRTLNASGCAANQDFFEAKPIFFPLVLPRPSYMESGPRRTVVQSRLLLRFFLLFAAAWEAKVNRRTEPWEGCPRRIPSLEEPL